MKRITAAAVAAAALSVAGCDDVTSGADAAAVTIGFSTTSAESSSLQSALSGGAAATAEDIVLTGDNGILVIRRVAFIVDEFKLERAEAACEEIQGDDDADGCEEFETGVAFVELPLNGATVPVVTQAVPAGTYVEMKLETDDADLDEAGDDEESAEIAALIAAIEAAGFTDWPENASLVIVGSFTPTDGETRDFVAFFEAEIKVELAFDPALVIDGESGTVDIEIDPAAWFVNADGTVIDLSAFDYATTPQVVEFEAKMEHGFSKIELEGFDD